MMTNKILILLLMCITFACSQKLDEGRIDAAKNKLREGKAKEAISLLDDIINEGHQSAVVYNLRGSAYFSQKLYLEAIKDFDAAIAIDSLDYRFHFNKGNAFRLSNKPKKAKVEYDLASQCKEDEKDIFINRGLINVQLLLLEDALKDFEKAAELDPKDAVPVHQSAKALSMLKMLEPAIERHKKASEMAPKNGTYLAFYAQAVYAKDSTNKEVCELIEKAIDLGSEEAVSMKNEIKMCQ